MTEDIVSAIKFDRHKIEPIVNAGFIEPCKYCSSEDVIVDWDETDMCRYDHYDYFALCQDCEASGPRYGYSRKHPTDETKQKETVAKAIVSWNIGKKV
jgi:hypothetical protein